MTNKKIINSIGLTVLAISVASLAPISQVTATNFSPSPPVSQSPSHLLLAQDAVENQAVNNTELETTNEDVEQQIEQEKGEAQTKAEDSLVSEAVDAISETQTAISLRHGFATQQLMRVTNRKPYKL